MYLDQEVSFKDHEIQNELKKIKIKVKDKELDPILFRNNNYNLSVNIKQTTYNICTKTDYTACQEYEIQKQFYRFSLDNQ